MDNSDRLQPASRTVQTSRPSTAPAATTSTRVQLDESQSPSRSDHGTRHDLNDPLPPLPQARLPSETRVQKARNTETIRTHSRRQPSELDWIVPVEEEKVSFFSHAPMAVKLEQSQPQYVPRRTVGERLQPTLTTAYMEKEKYAWKAKVTGYALNFAIGMQVLLGSLTTGLSVIVTTKRQASIVTTVLGGLATITASYLARARGSNEPELSITRVKDLEQFIRECEAFQMDSGHRTSEELDAQLFTFRDRFEELLGNGNGERKLAPPV